MPSLDGAASLLCESPEGRSHPQQKCAPKCVLRCVLTALIVFYYNRFYACVAERRKHLTVDQDYFQVTSWVRILPHAKHLRGAQHKLAIRADSGPAFNSV